MKMGLSAVDENESATARNFDVLCDIQVLLSMVCLVPLLKVVYSLIQFAQGRNIFIGDFVVAVKVCEGQLYRMFVDAQFAYGKEEFPQCALTSRRN